MACDTVIEIAGFRHRAADPALLRDGVELRLVPEPTNPHDPAAIRVEAADTTVGYVNRLQTSSMAAWLKDRDVSCWLSRRGGRAEAPVAFALLRMRCREKALAA